ncbi:MAG: hypothetical protein ACPLYF_03390, partial [Fervidobacterium sp.]
TADPDVWIEAFKKILEMDVNIILPGHGPLSDKDEVKKQLEWFMTVRSKMKAMIAEGTPMGKVIEYSRYPSFYESDRPTWRTSTLEHWYRKWSNQDD